MINILELKTRALNSRLVTDSFWALFGNVIGKFLTLAAGIIIAKLLGKDIYGEYGIIRNPLMSGAMFLTLGFGYTTTKFISEYKNSKPEYLLAIINYSKYVTFFVSSIVCILLFTFSKEFSINVLHAAHLTISVKLIAVWIVFYTLSITQTGILSGLGEYKMLAKINALIGILTILSTAIFTYFFKLNGALISLLLVQIVNYFINDTLIRKRIKKTGLVKSKVLFKELVKFSLPIGLQEGIYSIATWINSLLIINFSNYGELGLYSAAMQWNAIILFVPGILRNVILTHLSEANNVEMRHQRVLNITLIFNLIMTAVPVLIILIFSGFIAHIYGESFSDLKNLINIAVFATIFMSLSNVYAQAYMSKGKNWLMFFLRLLRDFGISITTFILLTKYTNIPGSYSLVYSVLFFNAFFTVCMVVLYKLKLSK